MANEKAAAVIRGRNSFLLLEIPEQTGPLSFEMKDWKDEPCISLNIEINPDNLKNMISRRECDEVDKKDLG